MGQTGYTINEYGEIIRNNPIPASSKLPTNRNLFNFLFFSIITLGIYGVAIMFIMGKETNIVCKEDGKHTRGFISTVCLSIITLGLYIFVWYYNWLNRDYRYLRQNSPKGGMLSGLGLLAMVVLTILLALAFIFFTYNFGYFYISGISFCMNVFFWGAIAFLFITARCIQQHNLVNKIYNYKS